MEKVAVARNAMATRFEMVLFGNEAVRLRAAAEEALDEIDTLERKLSAFRADSEISRLNARGGLEPVRVDPEVFSLLEMARDLSAGTGGAFDITVAPLLKCWGFIGASGSLPELEAVEEARQRVGMEHLRFFPDSYSVQFDREGMRVDLGAIGKGYAIERAAELLREAGVESALLHGGTSSIYAIGTPPGESAWKVTVPMPDMSGRPDEHGAGIAAVVELKDEALSVSGNWGKYFLHEGKMYGHVLDPRTGFPAERSMVAAVALGSATETDALSTALLITGGERADWIEELRPEMRWLAISKREGVLGELEFSGKGFKRYRG